MTTNTSAKPTLHQRAMHEFKELAIISSYLYITIGAVILMKTAVLRTEGGVEFIPWGIAIVKAVVLGKFVLLGNLVHLGGRNTTRPLIWPTLRRAFSFLVLLVVLTIIEEAVVGLFHHRSIAASLGNLFGARLCKSRDLRRIRARARVCGVNQHDLFCRSIFSGCRVSSGVCRRHEPPHMAQPGDAVPRTDMPSCL